jgi:hypothetical protein
VRGGFNAINRYFYENELSDGLPIIPPTREAIERSGVFPFVGITPYTDYLPPSIRCRERNYLPPLILHSLTI